MKYKIPSRIIRDETGSFLFPHRDLRRPSLDPLTIKFFFFFASVVYTVRGLERDISECETEPLSYPRGLHYLKVH